MAALIATIGLLPAATAQTQQAPPPAAHVTPDPWPKLREIGGAKYTLYQPQLDKWDGYNFEAHAAVSVLPAGAKDPVFGAIEITAITDVAKVSRTVHFRDIKIVRAVFPSALDKAAYQRALQTMASNGPSTMTTSPTELIVTEGAPDWVPIDGTMLLYFKNTTGNIFKNLNDQQNYVLVTGRWFHALDFAGPWQYIAGSSWGSSSWGGGFNRSSDSVGGSGGGGWDRGGFGGSDSGAGRSWGGGGFGGGGRSWGGGGRR